MKNTIYLLLVFITSLSHYTNAQKAEKVKGNRVVTIQQTDVESFHTVVVSDDFEIDIIYNQNPSVEIEADENLHEFILFEVRDSILSFSKTRKITSKKALKIRVNFNDSLSNIETRDDAKIHSLTTLQIPSLRLITSGNSKAGLTVKSEHFYYESLDKSKNELNIISDSCRIIVNNNSKLEALINAPKVAIDMYQRAHAEIEGNNDDLDLKMDNNTTFIGKNFTVKNCTLLCEIGSDATVEVMENITLAASGSSAIYLYGNPKIVVDKLENTSKIQKKEK